MVLLIIDKKYLTKIDQTETPESKISKIYNPAISRSDIIVGEKHLLKDVNEIETNFLLKVGMGISYAVVFSFLIFKLLA